MARSSTGCARQPAADPGEPEPGRRAGTAATTGAAGDTGMPAALTFEDASAQILDFLKRNIPLGSWSVTRYDGTRQVQLAIRDDAYGKVAGDWHLWSDSFCRHAVAGVAPQIAPDAMAVPEYAASALNATMRIGAYIGIPITDGDGQLFGTLCGLDAQPRSRALFAHAPLLRLLASLLSQILRTDALRASAVEHESRLHWQAFHDQLTGLPNRSLFLERFGHAADVHTRDGRPLAVLAFDLDDFKAVNESLGQAAGDALLGLVARRVQRQVRTGDTLARLSGDEFAVLLEDGADPLPLAHRLLGSLTRPFRLGRQSVTVRASLGVACATPTRTTPVHALLAEADTALYVAKSRGKGGVAVFDASMTLPAVRDLQLRDPLEKAIERGAVRPAFQPIVELASGRVTAFEALARWDLAGTAVPPDQFIPVAARTGLLHGLTDSMLDQVGAQLASWSRRYGDDHLTAAVNIPPSLVVDTAFPDRVGACIARHALRPGQLVLELTEDALLTDFDTAQRVTRRLRSVGAVLSLDDFGSGASSLLHLQRVPLTSMKVDRSFAVDLDSDPGAERFMRALLHLGGDMGLQVVVEGIERPSQAAVLRRLGCTHVQGYLFGRPSTAADIDQLLDRGELVLV